MCCFKILCAQALELCWIMFCFKILVPSSPRLKYDKDRLNGWTPPIGDASDGGGRLLSSRNLFLGPLGSPKEVKINEKLSSEDVENKKVKMFLGPNGGQEGAQMGSKVDFYSN